MDAAWYPDPSGRHQHRYWDGAAWTDHVGDGGAQSSDPVDEPLPPPAEDEAAGESAAGRLGGRLKSLASTAAGRAQAELDRRRAADAPTAADAATGGPVPIFSCKSHEAGRNSTITLWPDRIERVQDHRLGSLSRAKQDTEVIPVRAISSVQAKKDGLAYTKVTVYASGNNVEFRVGHAEAQRLKDEITKMVLAGHDPAPAPVAPVAPDPMDQLRKLGELRDAGILSDAEFAAKKAEILERM